MYLSVRTFICVTTVTITLNNSLILCIVDTSFLPTSKILELLKFDPGSSEGSGIIFDYFSEVLFYNRSLHFFPWHSYWRGILNLLHTCPTIISSWFDSWGMNLKHFWQEPNTNGMYLLHDLGRPSVRVTRRWLSAIIRLRWWLPHLCSGVPVYVFLCSLWGGALWLSGF